jgi:DNA primase
MDTVSEIKNRADIVELISQYTVLTRSGKTMKGLCPFHSEKHGSFFVYPESGTWHCFGACATGGDVFSFIMKKEGLSFSEALERLAEKYGVPLPSRFQPIPEADHRADLFAVNAAAAQYFHDLLLSSPAAEKARAYLEKRGVNAKSVADFQIGYALPEWQALKEHLNQASHVEEVLLEVGLLGRSDSGRTYDRFRDQIMFPISDNRGRVTGFGARVLDDSQPKYLNSPETPLFSKSATLYGINLASSAIRTADAAVIVEGYLDVIISHQYGFNNTVASMGTAINEKQLAILKKLSPNLILALDADAAGEEATARCVPFENILEHEIKVLIAPAGKDPDDVIKADADTWRRLLGTATPIVDFVFDRAAASVDLRTARGKADLAAKLLPVVAEIKDPVRRGHYLSLLAGRVGTTTGDLQYNLTQRKLPKFAPTSDTVSKNAQGLSLALRASYEDHMLALILKYPEIKTSIHSIRGEYFNSVENREIFRTCLISDDPNTIRHSLDPTIWEQYDRLIGTNIINNERLSQRFTMCAFRLEKEYLKMTLKRLYEIPEDEDEPSSVSEIRDQKIVVAKRLYDLEKLIDELPRSSGTSTRNK